jgi:hypothetical protein
MSDLRVMRERQLAASSALDRSGDVAPYGSAALCVVTKTVTTYPTSAAEFFACTPQQIVGSVAEGASPTFIPNSSTVYALNVGTQIPPSGTNIVIHSVGGRWVFRYDG